MPTPLTVSEPLRVILGNLIEIENKWHSQKSQSFSWNKCMGNEFRQKIHFSSITNENTV